MKKYEKIVRSCEECPNLKWREENLEVMFVCNRSPNVKPSYHSIPEECPLKGIPTTGDCYLFNGESGLICSAVASFPEEVKYECSCPFQQRENNVDKCIATEECDFRR